MKAAPLAERVGFEPTVGLHQEAISSAGLWAARLNLRFYVMQITDR
jgi:hypothetical protein